MAQKHTDPDQQHCIKEMRIRNHASGTQELKCLTVIAHLSDGTPRTGRSLPFRSASAILKQKIYSSVSGTYFTWVGGEGNPKMENIVNLNYRAEFAIELKMWIIVFRIHDVWRQIRIRGAVHRILIFRQWFSRRQQKKVLSL